MKSALFQQFENIVLLDTETTGIEHRQDEIIELAALRAVPSEGQTETAEELDLLIRLSPGRTIPPFIQKVFPKETLRLLLPRCLSTPTRCW